LGKALKLLGVPRHQFVLSTKIFFASPTQIPTLRGLSRKHIIEGIKKSLKNLEYDYVDILFSHRPDDTVPMEEICRAFDWVVRKGLAFYWGTSEWNQDQIA
jgi:aryl-alcohol dehydrogenase-like predicted oxidoreductase